MLMRGIGETFSLWRSTEQDGEDFCTISCEKHLSVILFHHFLFQEKVKMSYYHLFCALLAEQNRRHIRVVDFFGSVVGSYLRAERSFVCVQELVRVFSPCRRHFCYFPHFYKRTQVGGPFPEALGPLPVVGNNQINVAEEYSLHGQHLIAILLWNYSSQS